jgi:hypothetical protein
MQPTVGYKNRESRVETMTLKNAKLCAFLVCAAVAWGANAASAATLAEDADTVCKGLVGGADVVRIDSAVLQLSSQLAVAERGPTPSGRIAPANPGFCKVLGHIDPADPKAPPIKFQVNLPVEWNGRSVQYGGGGFNGVLITGLGLPPAYPFDKPSPLARGFVTYGTDSGHESRPGEPPQLFALNDEAFENFAHRAYKKVRDAAVVLMERAYGKKPEKMYFMGSSEGGREGLTMAQRYPDDFDGIFARVPVINWVGLQHAGTRSGLVTMGEGWINPAQVKLVGDAVRAACDKADGSDDALVQDPVSCKAAFKVETLQCASGKTGDQCLRAEGRGAVVCCPSRDAAVPLAGLAALQVRASDGGVELYLRAVRDGARSAQCAGPPAAFTRRVSSTAIAASTSTTPITANVSE